MRCREQAEEFLVEEGGFPEAAALLEGEEGGGGLHEVCIDMAAVIQQVRLLASATQVGGCGWTGEASGGDTACNLRVGVEVVGCGGWVGGQEHAAPGACRPCVARRGRAQCQVFS